MEREWSKEGVVIPIKLRDIDNWRNMPFGGLQAIPRDRKPVVARLNCYAAFAEVARELRRVGERLKR